MDVAGDQVLDHFQHLTKQRLDLRGRPLGIAAVNADPPPVQYVQGDPNGMRAGLLFFYFLLSMYAFFRCTSPYVYYLSG